MTRQDHARHIPPKRSLPLGTWLRQLRQQRGLPLRAVAAGTEMDSALVSKIELGQRLPTERQAEALADFYGVPNEEMEARRIAARFLESYGRHPAAGKAIRIVREQVAEYKADKTHRTR